MYISKYAKKKVCLGSFSLSLSMMNIFRSTLGHVLRNAVNIKNCSAFSILWHFEGEFVIEKAVLRIKLIIVEY